MHKIKLGKNERMSFSKIPEAIELTAAITQIIAFVSTL